MMSQPWACRYREARTARRRGAIATSIRLNLGTRHRSLCYYLSYLEAWWMKSVRHEEDEPVLISRVQRIWIHGPLDPNTPIATYISSEYGWLLRSTPV